jgi:molybdate transport system substrate-binding protein
MMMSAMMSDHRSPDASLRHRPGSTDLARSPRRAAMSLGLIAALSAVLMVVLVASLLVLSRRPREPGARDLFVFCAAGLRYPMQQIVAEYERECGVTVSLQYGGSNTLLSQLKVGGTGDLFLAADDSFIELAAEAGLTAEIIPLAQMRLVIVVRQDSTRTIESIDDILQPDLRVACANADAAAAGSITRECLEQSGHWPALARQINESGVYKPTVNDVANDVKLGSVDAGIVWDTTAAQYPELRAVDVPELAAGIGTVSVAVLESARHPTAALRLARYIAAADRGLPVFQAADFQVVEGDPWQEEPEITLFAGAVNRRALAPIVQAFEQREGVRVNTVYNGCGILTGQMQILAKNQDRGFPDVYMACDVYYLDVVRDWFQEDVNVSDTDIVIVVQPGNPKQILALRDLLQPGVRVALGQPEQCTIGVLSRRLLEHEGLYDRLIAENVVTQTATSALLVPAVTTRSVDAALAYRTDTLTERDKLEVVSIESELSRAVQPFSIARSSPHKHLGRRLFQTIARSRDVFESAGFHWRLDVAPDDPAPPTPQADHPPETP